MNKLNKILLNTALLFMIAELSYINSKSLLHLSGSTNSIHQVFAIVGAVAFSIVTIRVMQEDGLRWQKILFPIFDAVLVFLGFNLDIHPNLRIYLTIFMAVFAGLIMYSLGLIEHHAANQCDSPQLIAERNRANTLSTDLEKTKVKLGNYKNLNFERMDELQKQQREIEAFKTKLLNLQSDIEVMRPIYLASEKSRILKKNSENRTPQETQLLESA